MAEHRGAMKQPRESLVAPLRQRSPRRIRGVLLGARSTEPPTRYTSSTRSAVPGDAQPLRCQAPLRAGRPGHTHPARRSSTWSGAFRARLRSSRRAPSPRRPCRGPGATCHPWGQGGRHGWRSPWIRHETVGGAGRRRELRSRAPTGRRGSGEARRCQRRGDRARRHLAVRRVSRQPRCFHAAQKRLPRLSR